MLEIFILVAMCRHLHKTATNKGYAGWPFAVLMVFGWFVGGIGGAVGGVILMGDGGGEIPVSGVIGYLLGVALACIGNALLVAVLPARERPDDEDDDRPRRQRAYDDDEYDDRDRDRDPRRGRRYADEDDDPGRDARRRRYEDEDDDRDDRRGRYDDRDNRRR